MADILKSPENNELMRTIRDEVSAKLMADMGAAEAELADGLPQVAAKKYSEVMQACHELFLWKRFQVIEAMALGAFSFATSIGHQQTSEIIAKSAYSPLGSDVLRLLKLSNGILSSDAKFLQVAHNVALNGVVALKRQALKDTEGRQCVAYGKARAQAIYNGRNVMAAHM